MLLEQCTPGETLATIKCDDQATQVATEVMQKLWKSIGDKQTEFKHTRNWFEALEKAHTIPKKLIDAAIGISTDLFQSLGEEVLLHGDLHHDNILSAEREPWLVIDPKGIIGEREYEFGALLRKPHALMENCADKKSLIARRISIIREITGFDIQKIKGWAFAQAVLSAWWSTDDGVDGHELMLEIAENIKV